jgi:hypothetical protein
MGVCLFDRKTNEIIFDVNFWHYRAIVEAIRALRVISDEKVNSLHESWMGNGLTAEEARCVSQAIRDQLLPFLRDDERLLLDGTKTTERDDGTFFKEPAQVHKNYSTNREVIERFIRCCETCNGFVVC